MTAALALKETAAIYEGALERPKAYDAADYQKKIRLGIDGAERLVRTRKIKAISERAKLDEAFTMLRTTRQGVPADLVEELDKTIAAVAKQISEQAQAVESVQKDGQELLEQLRVLSPDNFKVVRKELARFISYGKEMHSDIVDMYYFLLSLKSELDPDATISQSFDNPDELRAFMDSEIAE